MKFHSWRRKGARCLLVVLKNLPMSSQMKENKKFAARKFEWE